MLKLASLLRRLENAHREQIELEREIAEIERQIVANANAPKPKPRTRRSTKAEMVELVRSTVDVLRNAGGPLPCREVASRLGVTLPTTNYRLKKAIALGFVEKASQGRYRVASEVAAR